MRETTAGLSRSRRFTGRWPGSLWIVAIVVGTLMAGSAVYVLVSRPTGASPIADGATGTTAAGGPGAASATSPGTPGPSGSATPTAGPTPTARPTRTGTSCPIAGGPAGCPAGPPAPLAAGKQWKLTFSEEFNGTDYDHSKLTPCFDWNTGECTSTFNQGREHYQPSQVVVSNGTAKLIAAPLSPPYQTSACQNGSCTYKAGLLSTARPRASGGAGYLYKFTYGYVESRFKFPATQGFFTAFWMLPADPSYNYQSEIDILELLGNDPTTMFMTYSYSGRDQSYNVNSGLHHNGACAAKDYSKGFVRMGVDWQPDHIAWYIDGVKCARVHERERASRTARCRSFCT